MKKKYKNKYYFKTRSTNDLTALMLDHESVLFCDKCKERLGILHTLRYALFKKPETTYYVKCKICHYQNPRVKGEYKQDITQKWDEMECSSTEKTKKE